MAKFNPTIQIKGLKEIENDLIKNLTLYRRYNSNLVFNFSFSNIFIKTDFNQIERDFSDYKIEIEYSHKKEPKVFIREPLISSKAPHRFSDKSLCLYKKTNFIWTNHNSIAKDIIPLIIMWIYYYDLWQITGIWYGKEANH